jgi:hypothetical protein
VLCLARNPRGFGVLSDPRDHIGEDALIIGRDVRPVVAQRIYGVYFDRIDELPPITIMHEGRPAFWLSVYLAHKLRDAPSHADLLDPAVLN